MSEATKLINKHFMAEKKKQSKPPFTYREQHAVIVVTDSETDQKKAFQKLKELGFDKIKVVSV